MRFFYNLFIWTYGFVIGFVSLFNHKASLWVNGRKQIFKKIEDSLKPNEKIIWFHCASLGEFEQGRPLIEKIKRKKTDYKIFLTFFSPSGYEIRKDYEFADYIFYLPSDTPSNAKKLIKLLKPEIVFFVKYEFWFNYISQLKNNNIALYLVSGVFRKEQYFFKPWGGWFRKQLRNFTFFFLQDESSAQLLNQIGIENQLVSGDSRFDRVSEILDNKTELPIIDNFSNGKHVLCVGSSWPPDEEIILKYFSKEKVGIKLIIAPHDIGKKHIEEIKNKFRDFKTILYSEVVDGKEIKDNDILIIDSIGLLNMIYQYAHIAYIGGGFGVGIHNLLEPAVYSIPVLYGPAHKHFREAVEMSQHKGGFPIENAEDFKETMSQLLSNKSFYNENALSAGNYIKSNTGATKIIFEKIFQES